MALFSGLGLASPLGPELYAQMFIAPTLVSNFYTQASSPRVVLGFFLPQIPHKSLWSHLSPSETFHHFLDKCPPTPIPNSNTVTIFETLQL